ncbi:M56 family metallopeptidase [Oleiagrimonas soli]|uniref:TonB family protein n=1 Tax=Oleiagrimonas soli TaxID=1543381 RepID=A0A841KNM0_9GAMM|nr:TonB family protein [Oleiagrimonas soli]MBB6183638.1 TonB family protein [Oleiagrimonas soli]
MSPLPITMLLGFTGGLVLTLALRRALRRHFGARHAYTAWLLPIVTGLAPCLPSAAWTPDWSMTLPTLRIASGPVTNSGSSTHAAIWLALAWATVASFRMVRLLWQFMRVRRAMHPLPDALRQEWQRVLPTSPMARIRLHPLGPAVIAGWPSRMLLPVDFTTRFDRRQQRLILLHEQTHLRRGDAWWNLLAETLCALLWFHPLVGFARNRFRTDQELACDACVLRAHPQDRRDYAHALLRGIERPAVPALAAWLDEPHLKERLLMIHNRAHHTTARTRGGLVVLTLLIACSAFAAHAMQASGHADEAVTKPVVFSKNHMPPAPIYPESAKKNRQEGTVIVLAKVGTDGRILSAKPEPGKVAPALVDAAVKAVSSWTVKPARDAKGNAVVAWVKIPIKFALGKDQDAGKKPAST